MIFYTHIYMIHWIPAGLSASDTTSVNEILTHQPAISGGGELDYYELVDGGKVVATVAAKNFRDAGVHFINTTWDDTVRVREEYARGVPISVRDAVVDSVERGDMCTCASECTDPECDTRSFARAREYIRAYEKKAASTRPPRVVVRHGGDVRTFTPKLIMVSKPTPDTIRDGVIAKMQIRIT